MKKFLLILVFTGILAFVLMMMGGVLAPPLPPGFALPPKFIPPETGVIYPFPPVSFTAFDHFSLKTFMGYPLGSLYPLAVVRFILTSLWFVLAVYLLLRYLRGFYGPRMIPLSWLLIVAGLIVTNVGEFGENFAFHSWPYLGILEQNFLLVLPHLWGSYLMFLGTWFLLREIKLK
jgi:hypothetical protein